MARTGAKDITLDDTDRAIINTLQGGFGFGERPFRDAAEQLGLEEDELIARIRRLVEARVLSRFGPMYNAERLGGAVTLSAMAVPEDRYDEVAEIVNAHRQVAHNYARAHDLNMWFVVASDDPGAIAETLKDIETETGLQVYDFPKQREFFIGLKVDA
jgi:DNA-binding Lrp family transcriptional regulator